MSEKTSETKGGTTGETKGGTTGETTNGSTEEKLVLEMLSEGKISVEDAQKLLDKLRTSSHDRHAGGATSPPRSKPKYLRIQAGGSEDDDDVDICIPLGLAKAGLSINSYLPSWVGRHVFVGGVDLAEKLDFESKELRDDLENLDVRLDSPGGEHVRIFCE